MRKIRERIREIYRKHTPSVKLPLIILTVLFCMIPLLVESRILASSSRQEQVERRIIDVQNQCQILSNKMSRSGYLTNSALDNAAIDTELSLLSDIFSGRILIVNSGFKIVEDTFAISDGKTLISDEVIRCFQGENTSRYDSLKHYFVLAIPIPEFEQETGTITTGKTAGVMIVTASTESMYSLEESLKDKASLYEMMIFVIVLIVTILSVHLIMKPFGTLIASIRRAGDGNLDEDVNEEAYRETKQISGTINKTLEKLKAVDQSRQEFVSNVSHELKTPLTSILGTAEILQNGLVKPEDVPHFAGNIHRETERLIGLVNDIIKLSRLDEGGGLGQWETVDLYEEARAVLEQLAPAAQRKQVTTRLQGGEALVRGVPQIVEEIVYNLCDNAIAYSRANGSVTVTVENTAFGPRITVADTGIGIPREAQGRVFERFYRVDKSHSSGGTGLGLSIVKHGAAYLGAQVELHSEPGHGSTFTLTFPKAGA